MQPMFNNHNAIVLASDNNYCSYLAVTVKSIIDNCDAENAYDIVILSSGISDYKKQLLSEMQRKNVSIRFFDMEKYMQNIDRTKFYTSGHISISSYYRIFIPDIFKNYHKVFYLDCDIIVLEDVYKIFAIDLEDNIVGVVHDIDNYVYDEKRMAYMKNNLNIDYKKYFNAGVMLIDIPQARQYQLMEKSLDLLDKLKSPLYHDQTLLNGVCYQKTKFLDMGWNYQTHFNMFHSKEELKPECPANFWENYMEVRKAPKLLHYTAKPKPWENPSLELAGKWWEYARKTSLYEEILFNNLNYNYTIILDLYRYKKYRLKYFVYKTAYHLTFGNMRQKFKQKKEAIKPRLKNVKKFVKNFEAAA